MRVACEGYVISNGVEFTFTGSSQQASSSQPSSKSAASATARCAGEEAENNSEPGLILQLVEKLTTLEKSLEPDGQEGRGHQRRAVS